MSKPTQAPEPDKLESPASLMETISPECSIDELKRLFPHITRFICGALVFNKHFTNRSTTTAPQQDDGEVSTTNRREKDSEKEEKEKEEKEKEEKKEPPTRVLILHRAATDSFPNTWDYPGGSIDDTDKTLRSAIARELIEETGLRLHRIVAHAGVGIWSRPQLPSDVISDIVSGRGDADGRRIYAKFSFVVEVEQDDDDDDDDEMVVKCDPEEHQGFRWVERRELEQYTFMTEGTGRRVDMAFDIVDGLRN